MGASMTSIELDRSQHIGVVREILASFLMQDFFQEALCRLKKCCSFLLAGIGTSGSVAYAIFKMIFSVWDYGKL